MTKYCTSNILNKNKANTDAQKIIIFQKIIINQGIYLLGFNYLLPYNYLLKNYKRKQKPLTAKKQGYFHCFLLKKIKSEYEVFCMWA